MTAPVTDLNHHRALSLMHELRHADLDLAVAASREIENQLREIARKFPKLQSTSYKTRRMLRSRR